jgi:hypothetical protein
MVLAGGLGVEQHRPQQHEVAELRVDDVAMDAHVAEAGGDGHRLVADHPNALGEAHHLHGKAHRRADGPDALRFQPLDDPQRDLVDLLTLVMELEVGDRARRTPHRLAAHSTHEREKCLRPGIPTQDLLSLVVELGPIDGDEADVVGAALPGQSPQPVGRHGVGPARRPARSEVLQNRGVVIDLHTSAPRSHAT